MRWSDRQPGGSDSGATAADGGEPAVRRSAGMEWSAGRSLTIRMVATLVLVAVLPVAFVYALMTALGTVLPAVLTALTGELWRLELSVDPIVVLAAVAVGFALQYLFGERAALRSIGARRVAPEEYPELHATLSRLAAGADVIVPDLAVSDSDVPNAFTVGRRPDRATVVVTRGLLETLDDVEVAAVLAHELAHVKNRDVTVMTLAYVLPTLTYLVAIGAYKLLQLVCYVVGDLRIDDEDDLKAFAIVLAVVVTSALVTIAVAAVFWAGSYLVFRILSRYREYAADRGAATITGDPLALASALRSLDEELSALPDADLREQDGGLEALYVAPIDTYQFGSERDLLSSDVFPETHPPTDDRIERLADLAARLE